MAWYASRNYYCIVSKIASNKLVYTKINITLTNVNSVVKPYRASLCYERMTPSG